MDHGCEGVSAVKAIRPPHNQADLVIETFGEAVGQPGLHVGEDAVLVLLDGGCELDERLELRPQGPAKPAVDAPLCAALQPCAEVFARSWPMGIEGGYAPDGV